MSHAHPTKPHADSTQAETAREAFRAARRDASRKERERLLDDELDDTFPASDPPSWTLGGSHVSRLRH